MSQDGCFVGQEDYNVEAAAMNGRPQRLVAIERTDGREFRDHVNVDSATSRQRYIKRAADKFSVEISDLDWLEDAVIEAADDADAQAEDLVGAGDGDDRKNQATQIVELAANVELFHDPAGDGFARFPVKEHWEVARVNSRLVRRWLAHLFYSTTGKIPGAQAVQDAVGILEAKAVFKGDRRTVHVRIAGRDAKIYLDLANEAWQVVEVSKAGWRILDESPVMFRRAKAMLPLPVPVRGGSVEELRRFVHVCDDEWPLIVGWLLAALRPQGPYPNLNIQGEHGSGKSTVCRITRALTDPNTSPLRSEPRDPRDLMIAANNGGVVAFDNLSHVQPWLSDCLCRLATGGGFSTRMLYENDEEVVFDAQRPVIINGIDQVATRADLLDRCLLINLPRIDKTERRSEAALWNEFNAAQPRILGALLTAVSTALRNICTTTLSSLPRMADFALWVSAAQPALGWPSGTFLAAYAANQEAGNDMALEASPVAKATIDFVDRVGQWSGTMTDLLHELEERADEKTKNLKAWPRTASTLGSAIKRLAPNLRKVGVAVDMDRTGKRRTRVVKLARYQEQDCEMPSAPSAVSAPQQSPVKTERTADSEAAGDWVLADDEPSAVNAENLDENREADWADEADGNLHDRSNTAITSTPSRFRSLCSGRLTSEAEQQLHEREG